MARAQGREQTSLTDDQLEHVDSSQDLSSLLGLKSISSAATFFRDTWRVPRVGADTSAWGLSDILTFEGLRVPARQWKVMGDSDSNTQLLQFESPRQTVEGRGRNTDGPVENAEQHE